MFFPNKIIWEKKKKKALNLTRVSSNFSLWNCIEALGASILTLNVIIVKNDYEVQKRVS